MKTNFSDNKFLHFIYEEFTVNDFINTIIKNVKLNTTYSMLLKVSFDKFSTFKMAGYQIGIVIGTEHNLDYYKDVYNVIINRIDIITEQYQFIGNIEYLEINLFVIKPNELLILKNIDNLSIKTDIIKEKEIKLKFNENLFPLTIDESFYGNNIIGTERESYIQFIENNNQLENLKIDIKDSDKLFLYYSPNNTEIIIISKKLDDNCYLRYIFDNKTGIFLTEINDKIIDLKKNLKNSFFERTIGKTSVKIKNQKVIDFKVNINLPKIEPLEILKKPLERNINIGTFDLETFKDVDGLAKVYAIGFYTRETSNLYYLTDCPNLDSKNLILNCIDAMLTKKYNKYIFYVHNLGHFDIVFLYNVLLTYNSEKGTDHYILNSIWRDNVIIKLEIKKIVDNKTIKIYLVDSLNLLNYSLDKLSKEFNVQTKKSNFPHSFVNRNTLNYIGNKPNFHYYNNLNLYEYEQIPLNNWNLKKECLIYLNKDLISLYEVMYEFSRIVYIKFNVQLTDALTITRLAINIYKSKFYIKQNIPYIKQFSLFNFIKKAYFGGITEVYKPFGKDLIYIDVNSLYPYVALNPMPGLNAQYIETFDKNGLDLDKLFGFFYAKVKTNNLYLGLLPIHEKNLLILPNGNFEGIWCSEELKFAKSKGYEITVIKGYNFNKVEDTFKDYIEELFSLKKNSTGYLKLIYKSLLNNFLGRFGLNINKPITDIINKEKKDYIFSTRKVTSLILLNEDKFLITYEPNISKEICTQHALDYNKVLKKEFNLNNKKDFEKQFNHFQDISIPISAFVTSYARIFINKIKLEILENNGNIYYSDTDSIILDKKYINPNWFSEEIGFFKLEYEIEEAYIISNKTYCLVLKNGKVIIKVKGVTNTSLTLHKFKEMYYKDVNVTAIKTNTITNFQKSSVLIEKKDVNINPDSYTKREKIFNKNLIWIDTKPLIYSNTENNKLF